MISLRERYSGLRYYYYHAGRSLIMSGNFYAGDIMLGYAVETTMKAGLIEVLPEEDRKKNIILNKGHGVRKIFAEYKKYKIFNKEIQVSNDFLKQINNTFQRYPSQIDKIMEDVNKEGYAFGNSTSWLHYYDDLIVQLDEYLLKRTNDPSISIIYGAIISLDSRLSKDILKMNAFALLKFDNYSTMVRKNIMSYNEDMKKLIEDNISKGLCFYWNPDCHNPDCNCKKVDYDYMAKITKDHLARDFELPREKLTSNGRYELKIGDMTIS